MQSFRRVTRTWRSTVWWVKTMIGQANNTSNAGAHNTCGDVDLHTPLNCAHPMAVPTQWLALRPNESSVLCTHNDVSIVHTTTAGVHTHGCLSWPKSAAARAPMRHCCIACHHNPWRAHTHSVCARETTRVLSPCLRASAAMHDECNCSRASQCNHDSPRTPCVQP